MSRRRVNGSITAKIVAAQFAPESWPLPAAKRPVLTPFSIHDKLGVLSQEHPYTLAAMDKLAATFEAQGNLERARALEEEILAIRKPIGEK